MRQDPSPLASAGPSTATENATGLIPSDPDLHEIISAWPSLPEAIKAGIIAMVKAASTT
jgi:hypothetical protein